MFDIGFWELAVIAVVALLVVGPEEFPALVRNIIDMFTKARRFVSTVRNDLEYEINKADEIKRLIAKEAELAKLQEVAEDLNGRIPVGRAPETRSQPSDRESKNESVPQGAGEEKGAPRSTEPPAGSP